MFVDAAKPSEAQDFPGVPIPMITSRDNGLVHINPRAIKKSKVLSDMVTNLNIDMNDPSSFAESLVCPVGTKDALEKVAEWCCINYDKPDRRKEDERITLTDEDIAFMDMKNDLLVQVLLVANFFDVADLMEIVTQKIANMAKDKTTEQLRKLFMLPDDLSPDEKEAIRAKHAWATIPIYH